MFYHAIVKTPCPSVINGITSSPELGTPIYEKALEQHKSYIAALKSCGVDVTVLDADNDYPDSCFMEDVAVVTAKCAIVTNPGAPTRKGEIEAIKPVLKKFYDEADIHEIKAPGTIEGGDVMMVGDTFYVGKSDRTNEEGIAQFGAILAKYGYKCVAVTLSEVLHLKTGVNYLANNQMLVSGEFIDKPEFASYEKHIVPAEEAYAANCIWFNDKVIVPAGFPKVLEMVQKIGFETIVVDTSEFRKIDGGLSCLSLRLPVKEA